MSRIVLGLLMIGKVPISVIANKCESIISSRISTYSRKKLFTKRRQFMHMLDKIRRKRKLKRIKLISINIAICWFHKDISLSHWILLEEYTEFQYLIIISLYLMEVLRTIIPKRIYTTRISDWFRINQRIIK